MSIAILVALIMGAVNPAIAGQEQSKVVTQHHISVLSHRIGVPFSDQKSSYFSGYGIQYDPRLPPTVFWKVAYQHRFSGGVFRQPYFQNGVFTLYSLGMRLFDTWGVSLWVAPGLGYQRSFEDAAVYRQNKAGDFEQVRDYGQSSLIMPLSIELAYALPGRRFIDGVYLQYRIDANLFYTVATPVFPHEYLAIGVRF